MNKTRNILFSSVVLGLCVILFCLIALASCSGNGVTQPKKLQLSASEQQLVQDCNDFSFNLLAQAASDEQQPNIILSPLSASMLLGMLMNGADGETLEQMMDVLGFDDDTPLSAINAYYSQLIDVLPALDTDTRLNLANGIWVAESFPLKADFVHAVKQNFYAEAKNVKTFADESVLNDINRFAAQHTNNLIKKVIEPSMVSPETVMALVNALYFKAVWKDKFAKSDTRPQTFTAHGGKQKEVQMMHRTGEMAYNEADDYQLVELPYKGYKYCADILLPAKGIDVRQWIQSMDAVRWEEMISNPIYPEVELALPKFTLKYKRNLTNDLKELGMPDAFGANADFTKLSDEPASVSLIHQHTFMQMDEEGTEAAAVTIGLMDKSEVPEPMLPKSFIADRPFVLVIRERDFGTILFTAIIGQPD